MCQDETFIYATCKGVIAEPQKHSASMSIIAKAFVSAFDARHETTQRIRKKEKELEDEKDYVRLWNIQLDDLKETFFLLKGVKENEQE